MRLLADTHVFLWWLRNDPALGVNTRELLGSADNEIYLSAVSVWEIGMKKALGKLKAPDRLDQIAADRGFIGLPITLTHADAAGKLEYHHADPFDRMLVAQARLEGLALVTADERIARYGVSILQARA